MTEVRKQKSEVPVVCFLPSVICHLYKEGSNIMSGSRGEDSYRGVGNQGKESVLSERLAFTGRIAASIAHEIRNPLGNVSIAAQRLKKASSEDSSWSKQFEVIIRNTERINFLITELLNCPTTGA